MYRTLAFYFGSPCIPDMFKDEPVDPSLASHTATPLWPQHPDSHYAHLATALPQWLIKASANRRAALGNVRPHLRGAFRNASTGQHAVLKRLNGAYWTAQNQVDQRLEHLKDAHAFGEPLLRDALKKRFALDLDVKATFLRLYIPATIPWLPIGSGAARSWTVSLLDAALHNFEASETAGDAYEPDSTFITEPTTVGQFETLGHIKDRLTIAAFIRLCRELDIGGQYQAWLEDNLGVNNAVVDAVLRPQIKDSQKAALRMALELALIHKDTLSENAYLSILGVVNGVQGMLLDGKPLLCHDLTLMSARLTGILLFAPDLELNRNAVRVVAYIPDDPEHPIKEYPSTGHFMQDLSQKLRSSSYQQFFSPFVAHQDRGYFFSQLNDRLTHITWHQHTPGDPLPSWRETAAPHTNLQFAATLITADLWQHLHDAKLNKILNDARTLAVSTASADRKARWELWDSFSNVAATLLQIASFVVLPFVPFLGEMMMAYMAYQLLDETFEGIVDWSEGLTRQALEHTLGVIESLAQLGVFAAGGSLGAGEFRKVLPKEWIDFIDRFTPVKTANGPTRYWNRDLTPYEQNITLATDSKPNELGLHAHAGKTILPLENKHYAVTYDTQVGQYQIEHPTRPDAYKPRLEHNNNGAWHTQLEKPLTWDRDTLLQRLGHLADSLSTSEREQVLKISGHHENALRRMHVNNAPLPPLVADTLKRFKIDKDIQTFIGRIGSEHSQIWQTADRPTQLQLLTTHFPWPENKALRLIDSEGRVTWQSANAMTRGARLHDIPASSADVLTTALQCLSDDELKGLFDEPFGTPALALEARANNLRSRLAQVAFDQQRSLFAARYRAMESKTDPLTQRLMDIFSGLPSSVAEELLNTASGSELDMLEKGTITPRLHELASWTQQYVRAVRAREGLELSSQNNPDTDRLALHSLPHLPGWSGTVRIDVNRYSFSGETIDTIGNPGASVRKVLVHRVDGDYQAYNDIGEELSGGDDLYDALLRALPDSERNALNLKTGQGSTLKQLLGEHALGHEELQKILLQHPLRKPHYDPKVMRLPGGADYPYRHPGATSLQDQVRDLYPAFTQEEAERFALALQRHPSGPRIELSRLIDEYTRLQNGLRIWCAATPPYHPETGVPLTTRQLTASRRNRALLADELQRCWRHETALNDGDQDAGDRGYMFRFTRPIIGELPTLQADFSHVAYLTLEGGEATRGAHEFLRHFTGTRRMEVRNIPLGTLPDVLPWLPNLNQLIMSNCAITLTAESQATLSSLSQMRTLELYKNPLGRVFSVEAMPQLDYIDLGETGISSLPPGLLTRPTLKTAIFSDNQFTTLPAQVFELPASKAEGYDFGDNPLSATTRNKVKAYFQMTREDLGVYAPQADMERVVALYPTLDREQASSFLYDLPGTLQAGRAELTRLETEYTTLSDTLAAWTGDIPARHPVSGVPFSAQEILIEHSTRDEVKNIIEQAWRRETELDDFNETLEPSHELALAAIITGDLPALSADFSHISHLYLHSHAGLTSVADGFLRCFPKLKGLTIRHYRLGHLPQTVFNMGELEALVLPECQLSLTAETVSALAGMERLNFLDLSNNPLTLAPDISQMPDLATLILHHSQITELPPGLLTLKTLDIANLRHNAIREIPSDILELPMETAECIDLRGNPFSEQSLQLLRAYFKQNGTDFGIDEIIETAEMEVSDSDDSEVEQ